jgi:hypothetical protein
MDWKEQMKKVRLNIFLLTTAMILFISCNKNSCEASSSINDLTDTTETIEILNNNVVANRVNELNVDNTPVASEIFSYYAEHRAEINSDCDFFLRRGGEPSGRLFRGQDIVILDSFFPAPREGDGYYFFVEIKTINSEIRGFINERYITYLDDIINDLWCKNILLTREYYYLESVEYIFLRDFFPSLENDIEREQAIRGMGHNFSEGLLFISERYLYIIIRDFSISFRLNSIIRDGSIYTFQMSGRLGEEAEMILIDDGNGITITHFSSNDFRLDNLLLSSLNARHIPHDLEKSRNLRNNVLQWVQENRGS